MAIIKSHILKLESISIQWIRDNYNEQVKTIKRIPVRNKMEK